MKPHQPRGSGACCNSPWQGFLRGSETRRITVPPLGGRCSLCALRVLCCSRRDPWGSACCAGLGRTSLLGRQVKVWHKARAVGDSGLEKIQFCKAFVKQNRLKPLFVSHKEDFKRH